jgi:hypothetical protein
LAHQCLMWKVPVLEYLRQREIAASDPHLENQLKEPDNNLHEQRNNKKDE